MAKYENIPIEEREEHRLRDISEYLDGKIDREQLRDREQGHLYGRYVGRKSGQQSSSPKKSSNSFR